MGTCGVGEQDLRLAFLPIIFSFLTYCHQVDLVQIWPCHQVAVRSKASHLICLSLCFLVYNMGVVTPTFQGSCVEVVDVQCIACDRHSCGATSLPIYF